jgi:hypothetical protein
MSVVEGFHYLDSRRLPDGVTLATSGATTGC